MRRLERLGRFVPLAAVSFAALPGPGCGPAAPRATAPPPSTLRPAASRPIFRRVTAEAGIRFRHSDGSSGRKYFPEVMGPGCAFADFSGDGRPDIYLLNGAPLPGAHEPAGGSRYYVNRGDGTFADRTAASGLRDGGYAIGCCAGDYDNDGDLDLYVTHLGRGTLYENRGDGTFADVTAAAGVGAEGFGSGAAFADYDGDGDLDLYVCRYVRWSPETNVACHQEMEQQRVLVYCRPTVYPPADGILYRNDGGGRFRDVTAAAGMRVAAGRSLGAVWSDWNEDGRPDLFVANDMSENFLFINQGGGEFREEALARSVALSDTGRPQASMGVASVDFDGDGHLDLACTHFSGEYLALWRNLGGGRFEDYSGRAGLVEVTNPYVGFGLVFPDLDLDGDPDLLVVNGHVTEAAERSYPGITLAQPRLGLLNQGGRFHPSGGDSLLREPRVGRGLAAADYDGDGRPDVLVANWRDEPELLRNELAAPGHWLRLTLEGRHANRSAIGARVTVRAGGREQVREVGSGGSYCSQSELALTFGLGAAARADEVRVEWPGGGRLARRDLAAGREYRLVEEQRDSGRGR